MKCPFKSMLNVKNHSEFLAYVTKQEVTMEFKDGDLQKQLHMIGLTKKEIQLAKTFQVFLRANIEAITQEFYQKILDVKHLEEKIIRYSSIEKLKSTLEVHLIEMFSGQLDQAFLERRKNVAKKHYRIGLDPKWYMGAFQNLLTALFRITYEKIKDPEELFLLNTVISKILSIEQQIVLEAYEDENLKSKERQHQEIKNHLKSKITEMSETLVFLTEQTNLSVQRLVKNSLSIKLDMKETSKKALNIKDISEQSQNQLHVLDSKITNIFTLSKSIEKITTKLKSSSIEMREFNTLIQAIATQTRLLAINSSIEATRANENRKSFLIISHEIQKLADQTKHSVHQMKILIEQNELLTQEVLVAIKKVQAATQCSLSDSQTTTNTFQKIVHSMKDNISLVHHVENEINQLILVIEEIGSATKHVAVSSESLHQETKDL